MENLYIETSKFKTIESASNSDDISIISSIYNNSMYITIEFDNSDNIIPYVIKSIKKVMKKNNIKSNDSALVVGLGNEKSTPDSLGVRVIDDIIVTRHFDLMGLKRRSVSAIKPGVTGETGIETKDIVKSIIDKTKPKFLIVIDSLKSNSINRLNHAIQITDNGIKPGSGVDNSRVKLNTKSLGIPVIAIGVPTVCDINDITNCNSDMDLVLTSKDIDFVINKLSNIIAISINKILYNIK